MKLNIILIFSLLTSLGVYGQELSLIYDCRQDSNVYISGLRVIKGSLYFSSGQILEPQVGDLDIYHHHHFVYERHVYRLNNTNQTATKVFHHDRDKIRVANLGGLIPSDSIDLYSKASYHEFTDNELIGNYAMLDSLRSNRSIHLKANDLREITDVQEVNNHTYFSAYHKPTQSYRIYMILPSGDSIVRIDEMRLSKKPRLIVIGVGENVCINLIQNSKPALYWCEKPQLQMKPKMRMKELNLFLKREAHYDFDMQVLDNKLYLVSKDDIRNVFNQIWMLE